MYLYHYYDKDIGPFKNISDVPVEEACKIMKRLKTEKPNAFCNQRSDEYLGLRQYYEKILRDEFAKKGGVITRKSPHYMVVEACDFLESWYENSAFIKIDVKEFDIRTISFTYGDSHPTFSERVNDGKEYRKKLYTYEEILSVIDKYGYPQDWNKDGIYGPERYIEVHIWSDDVIKQYTKSLLTGLPTKESQ